MQRAMRLLERVAEHPCGAPAKQLARETGLALPTAYHLLRTLAHEGYLRRDKGLFFLGEAVERLTSRGAQQKRRGTLDEILTDWRDAVGAPVYYARYREGEIEVVRVADTVDHPAVAEWAAFRETGHAHALGLCLMAQLDAESRQDHLARHPVRTITRYTVRDERRLRRRLHAVRRAGAAVEHEEYALGTVCAALPLVAGASVAAVGLSVPAHESDRLLPAVLRLRREARRRLGSLALVLSI
ncbi:IclR family transcriptional regulator [Streptomyces sp. WMMC905]|uniref:IclR family transcriptional regulator n=2 Tax=unclassified Streptomyces TaxID=2593676 RepID=UPI003B93A42D